MAIVSEDFLGSVLTNFQVGFGRAFDAAMNMQPWRELAMRIESNSDTESHNWLGTPPKMEDVSQTEGTVRGLYSFQYNLANREFQAILEVKRSTFADDKLGLIRPRLEQLGQEAARHPGELLFQLFTTNGNAFDNVAFFSDTRVIGESANIDNLAAGTGVTVAQFTTDLQTNRGTMRKYQDDMGRPMNLLPNLIVVPAELEGVAWAALNPGLGPTVPPIPATATGAWESGGYLVMVNPFLTDVNDWYLMHRDATFRPFVYQEREAPRLEGATDPNTEQGIIKRRFLYSAYARYEVGYGDPRYAIKIVN
jgi:phage major head subunit gpT-like protein